MPTYNPRKSPEKYPAAFAIALEKAGCGDYGQRFRTTYQTFPTGMRKLLVSQMMSGFKASLRAHPAHPCFKYVDRVRTKVEWEGDTAVIVSWKEFKPGRLLEGLV